MALNNNLFSDSIEKVIKNASKIALRFGSDLVGTEHILYGLASVQDCTASKMLASEGVTENSLFQLFEQSSNATALFGSVQLTPRTKELFQIAQQTAMNLGHSFIGTEHLLLAILSNKSCYATKVLANIFGVNVDELKNKLLSSMQTSTVAKEGKNKEDGQSGSSLPEKLLEMGSDITLKARQHKLDPVIGREEEIQRVIEILCRKTKNNPVLIGEAGVGKTAVVEGLAQAVASGDVPEEIKDKTIYSLEIGGLMAGTKYRGQMEEKLKDVIETIIQDGNIIVFRQKIPRFRTIGSGRLCLVV